MAKKKVQESSIDFPRNGLSEHVWNKEYGTYVLKPEVKDKIYSVLSKIPTNGKQSRVGIIHIVGSIGTNQYTDEADIDVHIQPVEPTFKTEAEQQRVMKWVNQNRDKIDAYIGKHPIEIFIQLLPEQDLLSDACYDVIKDKWIKGPKLVALDYDPYEDFSDVLPEVEKLAQEMDIKLGELKRDVIDFQTIEDAIIKLPKDQRDKLVTALEKKRDELEQTVKELYKLRKVYIDARHQSSKPTANQAKDDIAIAKRWRDANSIHKFLHRYKYTRLLSDLYELIKDNATLSNDEVDIIGSLL